MVFQIKDFKVTVASFLGFFLLDFLMQLNLIPVPKKCSDAKRKHKWRNSVCSILHAVIVGVLALKSLSELEVLPRAGPPMVSSNRHPKIGEMTLKITIGYFIFDMLDMIMNRPLKVVWPHIVHHFTTVLLSTMFIWQQKCLPYGILGLRAEVFGVFVYLRQLLLAYGISKQSAIFNMNSALNIVSFVAFRIPAFIGILYHVLHMTGFSRLYNPIDMHTPMLLGAVILLIYNLLLLWRSAVSDIWRKNGDKQGESSSKHVTKNTDDKNETNGDKKDN